jgi:hypothetical protein
MPLSARRRSFVVLLFAATLAPSCGAPADDSRNGTEASDGALAVDPRCDAPVSYEACGGPLDGTWTVDHVCGDRRVEVDQLYGGRTSFDCWIGADLVHEVRGTVRYAGGVETADLAIRARVHYVVPDTCAASLEPDLPPATFCARLAAKVPDLRSGGCVYGEGGCVCNYASERELRTSRPYAPSYGGRIVEFPSDESDGFTFCVDGDRMVQSRGDMFVHLGREP